MTLVFDLINDDLSMSTVIELTLMTVDSSLNQIFFSQGPNRLSLMSLSPTGQQDGVKENTLSYF